MLLSRIRLERLMVQMPIRGLSTKITAGMVKELRDMTGAPMMDCKKALQDESVEGDIPKAVDWLRAKGMAKASKNADREAKEGLISVMTAGGKVNNKHLPPTLTPIIPIPALIKLHLQFFLSLSLTHTKITLVEVNSETDFVGRNQDFQTFVASVVATAHRDLGTGPQSVEELLEKHIGAPYKEQTVKDALIDAVNGIRENISIKRVHSVDVSDVGCMAGTYVHGRVGVEAGVLPDEVQMGSSAGLVVLGGGQDGQDVADVSRKLAMHVVAARPAYASLPDVPADVLLREAEVGRAQLEEEGGGKKKPADIVERIIAGKVQKRVGELCLLEQAHVAEEGGPKVGKFLEAEGLSLKEYALWTLGSS
jgi:elongation factor Ts